MSKIKCPECGGRWFRLGLETAFFKIHICEKCGHALEIQKEVKE